jgi:hypothetical protein
MVNLAVEAHSLDAKTRVELGKAIADRHGVNHHVTEQEWSAMEGHDRTVWVRFTTLVRMSEVEFNELFAVARERALYNEEREARRKADR